MTDMLSIQDLQALAEAHPEALEARVKEFAVGGRSFAFNREPAVMGVINLSPDSWYRESVCLDTDAAIERGRVLVAQGAAMVDIGAESSLAHAERADEALQRSRLLPVIRTLSGEGILVSAETYNPMVARACLESGARVINLTGTVGNGEVFRMVADHEAAAIVCYVEGDHVRAVQDLDVNGDRFDRMREFFLRQIEVATGCGVERLFVDPGLGFYYRNLQDGRLRVRHQMTTFLNTFRFRELGWPVCHALPHAFETFGEEVRCAEPFFAVLAALGRTDLFRTHEVPRVRAVLDTLALWRGGGARPAQSRRFRE